MAFPDKELLDVYAHATFTQTFTYSGDEDLTDATAVCTVRKSLTSDTEILSVSPVVDAEEATVTLVFSDTETSAMVDSTVSQAKVVYDIMVTTDSGVVIPLVYGTITATQSVTR